MYHVRKITYNAILMNVILVFLMVLLVHFSGEQSLKALQLATKSPCVCIIMYLAILNEFLLGLLLISLKSIKHVVFLYLPFLIF